MGQLNFQAPTLYIDHHPDYSAEVDGNGQRQVHELPGHVYFGIVVNGVKIPLGRKGTAGLLADIKRAKAKQDALGVADSADSSDTPAA